MRQVSGKPYQKDESAKQGGLLSDPKIVYQFEDAVFVEEIKRRIPQDTAKANGITMTVDGLNITFSVEKDNISMLNNVNAFIESHRFIGHFEPVDATPYSLDQHNLAAGELAFRFTGGNSTAVFVDHVKGLENVAVAVQRSHYHETEVVVTGNPKKLGDLIKEAATLNYGSKRNSEGFTDAFFHMPRPGQQQQSSQPGESMTPR